jgi:hypothetical protein
MASLSKGTIYRIYSESEDKEYIGSTIMKLSDRLSKHKSDCKKWLEGKNRDYCGSFEILKTDDYKIECLEEVEFESKEELRKFEREWYDRRISEIGRDRVVNKMRPYISVVEDKERDKERYERNKDKILEIQKYYRDKNKSKISEQRKEYQKKNKDKISLKNSQKIHCIYCDSYTRKGDISTHNKTIKHITNFILF